MPNPINHLNPSVLPQIPLSVPQLHLERSQRVPVAPSHALRSRPCRPALRLVPAQSLGSRLPSHFFWRLPEPTCWVPVLGNCAQGLECTWSSQRAQSKDTAPTRGTAVVCVRPSGGIISEGSSYIPARKLPLPRRGALWMRHRVSEPGELAAERAFKAQHCITHPLFSRCLLQQVERGRRSEHWLQREGGAARDANIASFLAAPLAAAKGRKPVPQHRPRSVKPSPSAGKHQRGCVTRESVP